MSLRAQRHRIMNSGALTATREYGVILNAGARRIELHYTFQTFTGTDPSAELRMTSNHEGNDIPVVQSSGTFLNTGSGRIAMDFPPAELRLMVVVGGTTPSVDVTLEATIYKDE